MDKCSGIPAEVMKQVLKCPRCCHFPMSTPIFMCRKGHHICAMCYRGAKFSTRSDFPMGDDNKSGLGGFCGTCGFELTDTRNILAEQLLAFVINKASNPSRSGENSESSAPSLCSAEFPDESSVEFDDERNSRHKLSLSSNKSQFADKIKRLATLLHPPQSQYLRYSCTDLDTAAIMTYRPIRCPKALCNRSVAANSITSHFSHDHPEIPMLSVDPDQVSHLHVSPEAIPYDTGRCVSLLLLSGKSRYPQKRLMSLSSTSTFSILKTYIPLPILAARLRTNEELSVGEHGYILLVWVAHAIFEELNCTVEATNCVMNTRSLKYCGPVSTLRDSQKPQDVYARGDCLVINPGLLVQLMPEDEGYDVNVIIH